MSKFDKFCNQVIQEQYTVTARDIFYNRYGKQKADEMISKIRAMGKDSYLQKKYALPDYSEDNLNNVLKVVLKDLPPNVGGQYITIPFMHKIELNANNPNDIRNTVRELEGGEASVTHHTHNLPYDILGHEITHSLQSFLDYDGKLQPEIATSLSELKHWYYKETGVALDADMTDREFDSFVNYCKERNIFNQIAYGKKIDFEKLLKTSEGKEVFKRIVQQAPIKSNVMVA